MSMVTQGKNENHAAVEYFKRDNIIKTSSLRFEI